MRKFGAALLVSVFVFSIQGNAREPKLSALLLQARYVALGFDKLTRLYEASTGAESVSFASRNRFRNCIGSPNEPSGVTIDARIFTRSVGSF